MRERFAAENVAPATVSGRYRSSSPIRMASSSRTRFSRWGRPRRLPMRSAENTKQVEKIWNLVKHEHAAVLVSIRKDGSLDSIPMGCVQSDFDGTLWFLTFKD